MSDKDKLSKLIQDVQAVIDSTYNMKGWNSDDELHLETIREDLDHALFIAQKPDKEEKGYQLTYDADEVATCQVLKAEMAKFYLAHKEKYPADMYAEFLAYWSEPNGKKVPRWYSEKTKPRGRFAIPGRLATWFKRYKPKKQDQKEVVPQSQIPDRLKLKLV